VLRAGRTDEVIGHRPMAPSTLGTFLRSFTFGHVRQLDRVLAETLRRAWSAGAGPGDQRVVIDIDSFIGEVHGHAKQGAGYGYTRKLGYQPLLAARGDTGEVRAAAQAARHHAPPVTGGPRLEGRRGRFGHWSWLFRAKAPGEYQRLARGAVVLDPRARCSSNSAVSSGRASGQR
jgi:hypothetical protein